MGPLAELRIFSLNKAASSMVAYFWLFQRIAISCGILPLSTRIATSLATHSASSFSVFVSWGPMIALRVLDSTVTFISLAMVRTVIAESKERALLTIALWDLQLFSNE